MSYFTHKIKKLGLSANTPGGLVFEAMTTEQPDLIYTAIGLALSAIHEHLKLQGASPEDISEAIRTTAHCELFEEAKRIARICQPPKRSVHGTEPGSDS